MRTSDDGQKDAHEAQCNAIGRDICFNDSLFCDSTSQIVDMLETQPPAPNIHGLHIKCEHSPLLRTGVVSWIMEVIFPLLYNICEIAPVIQCQAKRCNSSFSFFLWTMRAPKMQLQVKHKNVTAKAIHQWDGLPKKCSSLHALEMFNQSYRPLLTLYSSLTVKHWAWLQELLGENQYDAGGQTSCSQ